MSAADADPIAALRDKYVVESNEPFRWVLRCQVCRKRWELKKPAPGISMHPGNILALLNHAAGHRSAE